MQTAPQPRERAAGQVWLVTAYDVFVDHGIEAVKIVAPAKKPGLAIRNWARTDESVQKFVEASDAERVAAVQAVFDRFGVEPDMAPYRSMRAVLTQTG